MNTILAVLAAYATIGILFLAIFGLISGRIRKQIRDAVKETQMKLAATAWVYFGPRMATVILLLTLWLFWPAVGIGALRSMRWGATKGGRR